MCAIGRTKILGIYVDKFFSSHKCQEFYDLLEFTYEHRGYVDHKKEKRRGDIVKIGWRHDTFIDKPVM